MITKLVNDKYSDIKVTNESPLSIETSSGVKDCKDWNEYFIEYRRAYGYTTHYFPVKSETTVREFEIEITEVLTKKVTIKEASQEEAERMAKRK